MFHTSEKLAVLIDGHALNAFAYGLGMKIDYRKLKVQFARSSKLTSIKYYAGVDFSRGENPYVKLLDWLDYNGYRVHIKEARSFVNGDGERNVKGSVIVDLSIDLVLVARHVDHVVLVSAHGDLTYPILQAKRLGARVTLLSSLNAEGVRPADELRQVADEFIELETLRDELSISEHARTVSE